jgi:alkanesulfonate monooxygenase SsuD/methylene tetrahydromethanopterin reductase-like flavin-dependent oxidoreductase (luciferase family)
VGVNLSCAGVRVCLMIEGQEGVSWDEWLALAEAAEAGGFEGLFRSDHYLSLSEPELGALDAWATLAALATQTERIRLGTLVSPVTFRHPAVLAKNAVTVDHVSGGRVELGLGAGWMEAEHRRFGFEFPPVGERMAMLEHQLATVRRLWSESKPPPVQPGGPPLIVGGDARPRSAALAARYADEYNTHGVTPEVARERRAAIVQACERVGREPIPFSVMTPVCGHLDRLRDHVRALEAAGVERVFLQHLAHRDLDTVRAIGRELV